MSNFTYSDELYHHGILGQKWGIRRYQYEDGSLTPEGREHYGRNMSSSEMNKLKKDIKYDWEYHRPLIRTKNNFYGKKRADKNKTIKRHAKLIQKEYDDMAKARSKLEDMKNDEDRKSKYFNSKQFADDIEAFTKAHYDNENDEIAQRAREEFTDRESFKKALFEEDETNWYSNNLYIDYHLAKDPEYEKAVKETRDKQSKYYNALETATNKLVEELGSFNVIDVDRYSDDGSKVGEHDFDPYIWYTVENSLTSANKK